MTVQYLFVCLKYLVDWMLRLPLGYGVCILKYGSVSTFYKVSSQGKVVKLIGSIKIGWSEYEEVKGIPSSKREIKNSFYLISVENIEIIQSQKHSILK